MMIWKNRVSSGNLFFVYVPTVYLMVDLAVIPRLISRLIMIELKRLVMADLGVIS